MCNFDLSLKKRNPLPARRLIAGFYKRLIVGSPILSDQAPRFAHVGKDTYRNNNTDCHSFVYVNCSI